MTGLLPIPLSQQQAAMQNYYAQLSQYGQTSTGGGGGIVYQCPGTTSAPTNTIGTITWIPNNPQVQLYPASMTAIDRVLKVQDGEDYKIHLPDGAVIDVAMDGSYVIDDKDAKVVYRASRVRDFNRFINISDRLEEFIAYCGEQGVHADEMLELPISLFIGWVILRAAEADKESPPQDIRLIPDLRRRRAPQCVACGRFVAPALRRAVGAYCSPSCFTARYEAVFAPPPALSAPQKNLPRD